MKYLGYWPFAIAVIWATTAGIALIHYGAAPAVAWHITTGAVLLVAVAGSNARHVAREHQVADRLLMQLRPVAPIRS